MRPKSGIYAVSAIVLVGALLVLALARNSELVQLLAGVPAVGALFAALMQVFRDEAAHQRALVADYRQHRFLLGATSHMANVAFDKHVAFVEAYIAETQLAIQTLWRDGPDKSALPHAGNLYGLRQKFAPWLTDDIDDQLEHFESTFREIGASAHYVRTMTDSENWAEQSKKIYKRFAEVMGWDEWEGENLTKERTTTLLLAKLRAILGTEELTVLRMALIEAAVAESRAAANNSSKLTPLHGSARIKS